MEYKNIILEKADNIGILYINRPKAMNALNIATIQEIGQAVDEVKMDNEIKVLIVTGAGDKAFVAGADIIGFMGLSPEQTRYYTDEGEQIFRKLDALSKPVIAAVNGFALGGGCELAMACDIRLASEGAVFGLPEVSLGVIPGYGGTQRLPRLIGEGRAKELTFTAGVIDAAEAYRVGLVNHVYPLADLMVEAKKLAKKIMKNAPLSVGYAKLAIGQGLQGDLDSGMRIESNFFGLCVATEDMKEGTQAFVEKRKPQFKGQ
ncbi:MAG: enoyl-CoA hydratase-related protein [Syntrophomonadaceae bacterium]